MKEKTGTCPKPTYAELVATLGSVRFGYDAVVRELETLRSKLAEAATLREADAHRVAHLDGLNHDLDLRIDELKAQLADEKRRAEGFQRELEGVQAEKISLLCESGDRITFLERELQTVRGELESAKRARESERISHGHTKAALDREAESLGRARVEFAEVRERLEDELVEAQHAVRALARALAQELL